MNNANTNNVRKGMSSSMRSEMSSGAGTAQMDSTIDSNAQHFFNSYDGTIAPSSTIPSSGSDMQTQMTSMTMSNLNSEDAQHFFNSYDGSTL